MWLDDSSSERDGAAGGEARHEDSRRVDEEPPGPAHPVLSQAPAPLTDGSHAGALSASCEALFRSTEQALPWAWKLLQLGKGPGVLPAEARGAALEFLDRIPPHVRRGVSELLAYSNLWQAVCTRLGRPVARSTEELLRELNGDLQLLLRGAQARLGTTAALEQGLLLHLGRLREARGKEPTAGLELRATLDAFTHSVMQVMSAASAYRRAWEAAEAELSESSEWLGAGDPGFCTWLAEHLSASVPAWREAHTASRLLQELGALSGPP
ncbi:hypothetical protein [Myxococcus landrumensis]|uniref:Uncharacterized protein n=1 Tax=Myxococcus landrumensis TaxID=2813577 RepID=A0ABX7NDK6_9BACT|nr:hypothetical protein [Myxococcus landrumus]QSQ16889.1 hypothetical protein JY572_12915 [Myxococcus landrumus]